MAAKALVLALVCALCASSAFAQPGQVVQPAQLPQQPVQPLPQQPLFPALPVKKVTPLVVPVAAAKLFNQPQTGITASFYGGQTDGGSCGYGSAQESGYGVETCSASAPFYAGGAQCGACFKMSCVGSGRCLPGATPLLTLTNLCTAASGPCSGGKRSYSLAPAVWNTIAVNPNIGVVPVRVTRVPCERAGGVQVKVIVGNPYYIEVLFSNVAGSGDIARAEINIEGTTTWAPMKRDYGAVFSYSGTNLVGVAYSFRLTTGYFRETIIIRNAVPAAYAPGEVYDTINNFKLVMPAPVAKGRLALEEESFNATLIIRQ